GARLPSRRPPRLRAGGRGRARAPPTGFPAALPPHRPPSDGLLPAGPARGSPRMPAATGQDRRASACRRGNADLSPHYSRTTPAAARIFSAECVVSTPRRCALASPSSRFLASTKNLRRGQGLPSFTTAFVSWIPCLSITLQCFGLGVRE